MDATATKPRPVPTPDTRSFWDGVGRRELLLQRCDSCGRHQFYPRSICHHCWGDSLQWVPATGAGEVYSFTVVHRPPSPAFQAPYIIAVVQLQEGVRMMANLLESPLDQVSVGMPVRVRFVEHEGGLIPAFVPAITN